MVLLFTDDLIRVVLCCAVPSISVNCFDDDACIVLLRGTSFGAPMLMGVNHKLFWLDLFLLLSP
ncbi:hypothetical protein HanXRQr2_Chr13g0593911 [Helianthus annuus]|uniref:Secreted protein n=1 Tax=Helianthus annuus TaxID=4232 RepID=A0A9K3EIL8_HELAN|nr:hypothetical protein HanXRQr2_Chr13g0593911 [Helianthus annuus]KAJ0849707.1 hypothetical protein HanPSC8_Chr13g0571961 [Helianthus annuus]